MIGTGYALFEIDPGAIGDMFQDGVGEEVFQAAAQEGHVETDQLGALAREAIGRDLTGRHA